MFVALYLFNGNKEIEITLIPNENVGRTVVFLRVFLKTVGPIIVLWLLGFVSYGALFGIIIIFLKGYINGTIIKIAFKSDIFFRGLKLYKYIIWDYLIIVPLLLFLSALLFSINKQKTRNAAVFLNYYTKIFFIAILLVALYSFIITLIWR